MGWFKRQATDDDVADDVPLSAVLGVREIEPDEWQRPARVEFAPKPLDLVRAARIEPEPQLPLSVPWSETPPDRAGVWWWTAVGVEARPRLAVVIDFGGRLSIRHHKGSASTFVAVSALARHWAGPVAVPHGVDLEDLDVGA